MALTKEQIKEFKEAEETAEDFYKLKEVADNLAEAGDKEWAKKVYKKAEVTTEESREFLMLANSLSEKLNDNKWAKKVYKKAEDKADCVDDLIDLAEEVCEYLDEKDLAKKIYLKADKACASENYYCYINLANSLIEKLDDRKWAKELYEKAEKTEGNDLGTIGSHLITDFGDKEWGRKVLEKGLKEAVNNKDKEQIKSYEELIKELC